MQGNVFFQTVLLMKKEREDKARLVRFLSRSRGLLNPSLITRYLVIRRYMHADLGTSFRLPKTRFQQHAHNEISGSGQDSLHGLARRLLRSASLEAATDIRVQAANRERGHYIQVRHVYL